MRWLRRIAAVLLALALVLFLAGIVVLRSDWFRAKVRARIVSTVEEATGGRVVPGAFSFDWRRLRADVQGLVIHGNESPDKPPLFRAASIAVGLKIVSALKRDVDIQYLDVVAPRVFLIVYPDG